MKKSEERKKEKEINNTQDDTVETIKVDRVIWIIW